MPETIANTNEIVAEAPVVAEVKKTFSDLLCNKAERLNDDKLEKKMKKVIKEGGKRGVEIEGAADMGGLQFFITPVEEPANDIDMLVESMRAMNAESDPSEEERKGGSGKIGKTIFCMTDDKLNVVAYVPEEHVAKCNAVEWLQNTVCEILKGGNDNVGDAAAVAKDLVKSAEGKETTFAMASIEKAGDKALFPLKMKDACINSGYAYLKARGLFPDGDDSDDEDDYVFGDDDFPSADAEEEVEVKKTFSDLLCDKAERLNDDKLEKKMKKVIKEGGKRGVEIEGAADMGGLQFFITPVEEPANDIDMLVESMRAMNMESDPTEEERKGGSGKIGKTIFSMTDDKLNVVAYVPEEHTAKCNAVEWLQNTVCEILKGGKVDNAAEAAQELVTSAAGKESTFAMASIEKDGEKALFPLKMKDACINAGYAYLKERDLFPDGDSDDEDDYVFGDDDFPEM